LVRFGALPSKWLEWGFEAWKLVVSPVSGLGYAWEVDGADGRVVDCRKREHALFLVGFPSVCRLPFLSRGLSS
jgi:hypothetical protein